MAKRANSSIYDPPLGFYFKVDFENLNPVTEDFHFQSVAGLTMEVVSETHKEGGNNSYDHVLPLKAQYPDLVLKRGLWILDQETKERNADGHLQAWCHRTIQSLVIRPTNLTISLRNAKGMPIMSWWIKRAWPKKWTVSDFNAEENQVVIETIELNYDYFTVLS